MPRKILLVVVASLFVFGMSKLSFAMMCCDHSGGQQLAQAHSEDEHSTAEAAKESVNVGNKICPVSGEKIDEETKTTYEYERKIYNFCCPACIDEFKSNPEKYIKKVDEELEGNSMDMSGHMHEGHVH